MGSDASQGSELTGAQLERLLDVGRALVSELDLETVLRNLLDAARDLTGARYAAVGVLDEEKNELQRFVFIGIDETMRHTIGALPRGHGVLGELIRNPEPLRLADVGDHERSYGFPANHPPMKTFLGTPVLIRGEAWGNLYLTEKAGGEEFTEGDEAIAIVLAAWAAVAIENARLYEGLEKRRSELERATRSLAMNGDISRAAASGMGIGPLVDLIAKRARSLVGADLAAVLVAADDGLIVASAAGEGAHDLRAQRAGGLETVAEDLGIAAGDRSSLAAPLPFRGRRSGVLVAACGEPFSPDDQRLLETFAMSAATTMASVRSADAEKVKLSIKASEDEKKRWARELHDETLQELGALRFLLETAAKGSPNQLRSASERALEHVDRGIQNLRSLITELRPAALDELGVEPAIESLAAQMNEAFGVPVELDLDLAYEHGRADTRPPPDLEAAIYRLVQEGMNNAAKHAGATKIRVELEEDDAQVKVRISDDGRGFDVSQESEGFGLIGMRERVEGAGGELNVESDPGSGTVVTALLPVARRGEPVA